MSFLPELSLAEHELEQLDKKVQELKRAFLAEESSLREIRDFVLPYRGKFAGEKANKDGQRSSRDVLCLEAVLALRTLAAGLQSGVTSPARPWFRLATADKTEESEEVRVYLDDTQKRMELVFARSNFYNSTSSKYAELGGFGTGVMLIEEDYDDVIRCRTLTAGEYWLGLDECLRVDKLARRLDMTARQLVAQFGEEALPAELRADLLADYSEERRYKVHHLIEPNPKHDPLLYEQLEELTPTVYRGVYWLEGEKGRPLKVEGYHEKPFIAVRWDVVSDAIYGRSPAWECLGLVKSTNKMESDFLDGLAMQVKPPMLVPSEMRDVNIYPGAINYYTEGSSVNAATRAGSFFEVRADLAAAANKIAANEQKINRFFYADLFAMLTNGQMGQMTAREVVERHEEKLLLLGPVLERLYAEDLNVCVERVYGIMSRAGLLMPPPRELEGQNVKIEYVSILAQAQKMVRVKGITELLQFVGGVAGLNAEVVERIDFQEAVKQYADCAGTPSGIVYGDEVFAERQAARAEQQEQMQQMAALSQVLSLLKEGSGGLKDLAQSGELGQQLFGLLTQGNVAELLGGQQGAAGAAPPAASPAWKGRV